jgi:hypothetical protein
MRLPGPFKVSCAISARKLNVGLQNSVPPTAQLDSVATLLVQRMIPLHFLTTLDLNFQKLRPLRVLSLYPHDGVGKWPMFQIYPRVASTDVVLAPTCGGIVKLMKRTLLTSSSLTLRVQTKFNVSLLK